MASTDSPPPCPADPAPIPALGPAIYIPDAGWIVTRHSQVRAVLADPAYQVPAVVAGGPAGTIGWLRSSACRFANGDDHSRRRALVAAELERMPPEALREDAERRAHAVIDAKVSTGRLDVMACLARRVPMAVLAARLGIADADRAADAVSITAAAYFPGADAEAERAADLSTARLSAMLSPAAQEIIAARITLMVQGCDATAGLIGKAVHRALQPVPDRPAAGPTDAILAEVLRYDPPLRVSRRVSREAADLGGCRVPDGSVLLLRVDSANRDPDALDLPALTFGYGLRPCPGQAQALALAAGVVQAVRDRCVAVSGPVEYEPPVNVRVPARLEAILS
jgi:cytochrome P450